MKNKKLWIILAVTFVALAAIISATVIITMHYRTKTADEQVTVTFETNGGNKVEPITLKKGEKLTSLPQSYLVGSSFGGWYTDTELSKVFSVDTAIDKDLTLYASFTETDIDMNLTKTTTAYSEDVDCDHSIKFLCDTAYTEKEFLDSITIESVSGYLPWEVADQLADGVPKDIYSWYDVTINGSEYTLSPKIIQYAGKSYYAYHEGHLYKITVPDGIRFSGMEDSVYEYTFRINEELKDSNTDNIKYNNIDNLHFINKESIKNIDELTEVSTEENMTGELTTVTSLKKDENEYYQLSFDKDVYDNYALSDGNILCIGNGESMTTDSLYVKVEQIIEKDLSTGTEYLVLATDADVGDVFDDIDVNFNQQISNSDIIASLDTEEIKKTIETNGSLDKVTNLITNLVYISDEAQAVYAEDRVKTQNLGYTTGLPDFCTNTYVQNEKTLLKASFLKDAEVKITIGEGHNPNFDSAYTDEFVTLRITFEYSTTIKDRLEVNAEIVFTQFLAVSAQGRLDYDVDFIVVKWVDFDYALNIYSQTDLDFKILVRTVKPDDDDKKDDKNNKKDNDDDDSLFTDISEKIADKLNDEDGDDPENIVAELREMLDAEDGYIELFRAPIIRIPIDIIPGIPVMRVTVELDFLVEMNFAAGFSAHLSVLEATQVGVTGDTRSKTMSSYQNDLPGGNRYAMQLSACGYLGFRAGFQGGLSVSFCGLSSLGRVGVYAYVGPYVDIYGFAQATLVKEHNKMSQSLVGGYYIEIGMFLKISIECRSDMFGVKVGAVLYDNKWPLVSFGNKNVLISIETSEMETVYIENKGETTATIDVSLLPALQGTYIDITTGETSVQDVPWSKVALTTSSYNFQYDNETRQINYKNLSIPKPASETCIATYYYMGSILQFNMSSEQYGDYFPFAQTEIIYYDSTKIAKEEAGQLVDVKIYSCIDGETEIMRETKVYTGQKFWDFTPLDIYKYTNIRWESDIVPSETIIRGNSEFTCYAETRQAYVAFIYYDMDNNSWITEIRACDLGDTPTAPVITTSKGKVKFDKWIGYDGVNNSAKNTPRYGIGAMITPDDICKHGFFVETTSGHDPEKSIAKYVTEGSEQLVTFDELFNNRSDSGKAWYYNVTSIYVADYGYDDCTVTVHSNDADGNKIDDIYSVPYGKTLGTLTIHSPLAQTFLGYATEEGGEIVYKTNSEIGVITKDIELYAVFAEKRYNVNLYYWDGKANEYKLHKSYNLLGGTSLGTIDLEGAKAALVRDDGKDYEFMHFADKSGDYTVYLSDTTLLTRDLNILPVYGKTVTLTFLSGDGVFPFDPSATQTTLYTQSIDGYMLTDSVVCIKSSTDKYDYNLVGWKNTATGEEISIQGINNFVFSLTCDTPSTFEPIFVETLRENYSITIRTEHGTLKNGEKEIVLTNVDYDTYISVKNEYQDWVPENVRDEENHCTYVYRGAQNFAPTSTSYSREYIYWDKQIDKHTITVNVGDGTYTGETAIEKEWNTVLDLSEIVSTKQDDSTVWKISGFTDKAGNTYAPDGKYTVTADDTLTPTWAVESYKEYKITLELDGKVIDTKTYHKNDTIEAFSKPAEADTKVFSGWTWYGSDGNKIEPLSQMPAEDLTLKGTSSYVYIKYMVDGKEISEYTTAGKVGYTETVRDIYEKEGYTVQPWSTSNASLSDGKFTMPEHDVIFTTTTAKNSYTLTYYHNGSVYGDIKTVPYGEYVTLIDVPTEDGKYLAWSSDDTAITNVGFTMPAHDVTITSMVSEEKQYIIYYIGDDIVGYETAISGQDVQVRGAPTDAKYDGMTFSGWYCGNTALDDSSTVKVGNDTIYILGYFTSGDVKVNIFFDENNTSPDITLYANAGDSVSIDMLMDKADLGGYKVNGETVSEIIIPEGSTEINAYVQYTDKTYRVRYYGSYLGVPEDEYFAAGETVYIADTDCLFINSVRKFYRWMSEEAEILQEDNDGRYYFIMPERDVAIYGLCGSDYVEEGTTFKTASFYINSPYGGDPIFVRDYRVTSGNTELAIPAIEGYELVCWRDEDGNTLPRNTGMYLSDMNGEDHTYYGEYRKLELHMIEYRLNNVTVGYAEIYDYDDVVISPPTVDLADGEVFSGWMNSYITIEKDGKLLYLTAVYEYPGIDFVFNGYIYNEEAPYDIYLVYNPGGDDEFEYEFHTNENATINVSPYENGQEYTYLLYAIYNYTDDETYTYYDICIDSVVKDNGQYVITIPTESTVQQAVQEQMETDREIELVYFVIEGTIYNPDSAY